MVMINETRHHT